MDKISYAQCWEDQAPLTRAIRMAPRGTILSVASGGDNTLAILLEDPEKVIAIDHNPAQIHLLEMKMAAMRGLTYREFREFMGVDPSGLRIHLYRRIRHYLSSSARAYWDLNPDMIESGIIHCGKFERYFAIFRKYILPLIHTKDRIETFLAFEDIHKQAEYYENIWNNRRWRLLFRIFFSRWVLGHLGRHPSLFRYVKTEAIAQELFDRSERGLKSIPACSNYFLEYIFTGQYRNAAHMPPYLLEENFLLIRERLDRITLITAPLQKYIRRIAPNSVSVFNLSDIFEYLSYTEYSYMLHEILQKSREGAIIAFWQLFVPLGIPEILRFYLTERFDRSNQDRTFFYDGFCVWQTQNIFPAPAELTRPVMMEVKR